MNFFNIKESFATAEDIEKLTKNFPKNLLGVEKSPHVYMPEVLDYPDDVWLRGCWENEHYFSDVANIVRKEFTLKQPLGAAARQWKEKILAAKRSVSLHIRHGDFAYNPYFSRDPVFAILPFEYYNDCLNTLRKQNKNKNLTLFVFSNNLEWVKGNFHFDFPTEFVEGEGLREFEELHLMSLCKHNIIANSTFSWWAAWLNSNPDKKVFAPIPSNFIGSKEVYRHFSPERNEKSPLESDRWLRGFFDLSKQPDLDLRPYFSLLMVVNNDAATLHESLGSIWGQDYKYYELIIIDNASTDGSNKICRQIVQARDNVTLIKLYDKISDGAAWNKALDLAQGQFVIFLNGKDRILNTALSSLYMINERLMVDVVNPTVWFREDERGGINMSGKNFAIEGEVAFRDLRGIFRAKFDKPTRLRMFADNGGMVPLASKVFKRKFLAENGIRFNEKSDDDAERLFVINSTLAADELIFVPNPFYLAPKRLPAQTT